MTKVVNLNQARKGKVRTERDAQAAENRVKFGRTKAEKQKARMELEQSTRALDQAKREP
jgi:hypothetical protein